MEPSRFAFARPGIEGMCSPQDGMTIREYFAGQAMVGLLAMRAGSANVVASFVAFDAFAIADAMVAECKERK